MGNAYIVVGEDGVSEIVDEEEILGDVLRATSIGPTQINASAQKIYRDVQSLLSQGVGDVNGIMFNLQNLGTMLLHQQPPPPAQLINTVSTLAQALQALSGYTPGQNAWNNASAAATTMMTAIAQWAWAAMQRQQNIINASRTALNPAGTVSPTGGYAGGGGGMSGFHAAPGTAANPYGPSAAQRAAQQALNQPSLLRRALDRFRVANRRRIVGK